MSVPHTGIKTPSFVLWLATFLPGLASLILALYRPGAPNSAVTGLVGGIVTLGSTIAKTFHDRGIHIATIQNAAAGVATSLPALEKDVAALKAAVDAATAAKV